MSCEDVESFYRMAENTSFCDPVTGIHPKCEREVSGIVAIRHQLDLIKWDEVNIYNVTAEKQESIKGIIKKNDIVLSEFPLFASQNCAINRWGGMAPDLIFASRDLSRITCFESKIDSHFTYSNNPPDGQISRYMEYLSSLERKSTSLIVGSPAFNVDWYKKRLKLAIDAATVKIPAYILTWELLFLKVGG